MSANIATTSEKKDYNLLTELDIISAKQWTVSCRYIYNLDLDDEFFVNQIQNAVDKLITFLPSLAGDIDFDNKIIKLIGRPIKVKYVVCDKQFNPDKQFRHDEFLESLGKNLFSVCLTKIKDTHFYVLGVNFSHGIVDGCGMYLVTHALTKLIDNSDYKVELTDDRNIFYKHFPILYKSYDHVTEELRQKRLNPMYFGSFFGLMLEKLLTYNTSKVKEQISFTLPKKSNFELCKDVISRYMEYYDYRFPVIGQIYDARKKLGIPELNNYVGNLSYIATVPVITDLEETLEIIKEKIQEDVIQNIFLYENALQNKYYIPNIDISKQTIISNSHVAFYPIIRDSMIRNTSPYRSITHNVGDCILFSKEKEGNDIQCYLTQQYGRKSLDDFL